MIFEHNFNIGLDDVDADGYVRDKSILRFLENIACFHADSVNQGLNNTPVTGIAWALLEWQVKIVKRPHYGDSIMIKTWGRKYTRTYVYRDYILYVNDEPSVYASSKWFCLNLSKRMPSRITEECITLFQIEDKSALGIGDIEKLSEIPNYDDSYNMTIRKSDIDMLGHLHNTNYLDLMYEYLDDETISRITDIKISYKKEIAYKDTVTVLSHKENDKLYFALKTKDNTVLNAVAELTLKTL